MATIDQDARRPLYLNLVVGSRGKGPAGRQLALRRQGARARQGHHPRLPARHRLAGRVESLAGLPRHRYTARATHGVSPTKRPTIGRFVEDPQVPAAHTTPNSSRMSDDRREETHQQHRRHQQQSDDELNLREPHGEARSSSRRCGLPAKRRRLFAQLIGEWGPVAARPLEGGMPGPGSRRPGRRPATAPRPRPLTLPTPESISAIGDREFRGQRPVPLQPTALASRPPGGLPGRPPPPRAGPARPDSAANKPGMAESEQRARATRRAPRNPAIASNGAAAMPEPARQNRQRERRDEHPQATAPAPLRSQPRPERSRAPHPGPLDP